MNYDIYQYMKRNPYGSDFTQAAFDKALMLIKEAVQDERNDELFYDYLISAAPTEEQKKIITSIRDDERTHRMLFREIYKAFTGMEIPMTSDEQFVKPASYKEGVRKAVFGELSALEKYRIIREGLPSRMYRDVVFRILTDEMKHATKYTYILTELNDMAIMGETRNEAPETVPATTQPVMPPPLRRPVRPMNPPPLHRRETFTLEEALEVAKELGVDFNRVRFNPEEFRLGLEHELNMRRRFYPDMSQEPLDIGRVVLEELNEIPDYYSRIRRMQQDARGYWTR